MAGKYTSLWKRTFIISAFNEPIEKLEVDSIENEFQYTKELMCLIKMNGKTDTEEFTNSKEVQVVNVREKLNQMGMMTLWCSQTDQL